MRLVAPLLAGWVLLVAATVGALVPGAAPAAASCAAPAADLLDTSDVAFSGVVVSRRESGDVVITTLRADRVFKGEITKRVDVVSPADEVDSSMTADRGTRLIVFGALDGTEVTSSLCRSVTAPGTSYREILTELGAGTEPPAGYLKAERRTLGISYDQFSAGRAIIGALGLSVIGYFLFRAWRARRRTT